jgi:hypothetical protein
LLRTQLIALHDQRRCTLMHYRSLSDRLLHAS